MFSLGTDYRTQWYKNIRKSPNATFTSSNGLVTASAFNLGSNNKVVDPNTTALTAANYSDERGLGVCSADESAGLCGETDGYYNHVGIWDGEEAELDGMGSSEFILLTANNGTHFSGLFTLGSLDLNSSNTPEKGFLGVQSTDSEGVVTITKFVEFQPGAVTVLGGPIGLTASIAGTGGLWTLTLSSQFNALGLTEVVFGANPESNGNRNDYLVRGASVVPIPAAAWLFGSALVGLVGLGRRKLAPAA